MSGLENMALAQTLEFSEVAAWGLIVALLVYSALTRRLPEAGAVALATAAALVTKAMLIPLL
jgi:hypothetical protein